MNQLVALVLLGVACFAAASDDDWGKCTQLNRLKIKMQWRQVYGHGLDRIDFGIKCFEIMFLLHPELREVFPDHVADDIYSDDFRAFIATTLGRLDVAISLLDNPEALHEYLSYSFRNSKSEGAQKARIELGNAMGHVVPRIIGRDRFDYTAWKNCYTVLLEHGEPEAEA